MTDEPVSTEPGCLHPRCILDHPHAGPAELPAETVTIPLELPPPPSTKINFARRNRTIE